MNHYQINEDGTGALMNADRRLRVLAKQYGYAIEETETTGVYSLRALPLFGYAGYRYPWGFKSVRSAAEHLIPVIREDAYRLAVLKGI